MTTTLHHTPEQRAIVGEQFRAVRLALRTEAYFYISALVVIMILAFATNIRGIMRHPDWVGQNGFVFHITNATPIIVMAFLIPFAVWSGEDPAHRAYHWTMPIARGPHTMIKLLCGWAWTMIATAVYLAFVIVLAIGLAYIVHGPIRVASGSVWEWCAAFTSTTIAYLLASIPVVGSNRAWRWIGGVLLTFVLLIGITSSFGMPDLSLAIASIWSGAYGLQPALVGITGSTHSSIAGNWYAAMPVWMIGCLIAVVFAAYRRQE